MSVTRRGFLGMLAGAAISGFAASETPKKAAKKSRSPSGMSRAEEMLIKYYGPMLKRNEAKTWSFSALFEGDKEESEPDIFPFYHPEGDKVTVGYGVNAEAHKALFSDIPIYYYGKELSVKERKAFFETMDKKDRSQIEQYTIKPEDADYLFKKAMLTIIRSTERVLADEKTGKVALYDLPFCMQALAVDICYNIGEGNFAGYKKFKAALKDRNYDTALSESRVLTNKKTKATNRKREWAKKRLLTVMRLVQNNSSLSQEQINRLIEQDYAANTTKVMRALNRHTKLSHELAVATGELCCIRESLTRAKQVQQVKKDQAPKATSPTQSVTRTSSQKGRTSEGR